MFDVGDTVSCWNLPRNLDVGKRHYDAHVASFVMTASSAVPSVVEVMGINWPTQLESWGSYNSGPTALLTLASGAVTAWSPDRESDRFTVSELPTGRIGVQLRCRNIAEHAALLVDASVAWTLVVSFTSVE
jgi:hypothetical protein